MGEPNAASAAAAKSYGSSTGARDARRHRRSRMELLNGALPRGQWPWPRHSDFAQDGEYKRYTLVRAALEAYCNGEPEKAIIAKAGFPLEQGQLWRLLNRALERNPATGQVCGYWVCKPGWAPASESAQGAHKGHLGHFFATHPDIEARICEFALGQPVSDLDGVRFVAPAHLRPATVYRFFALLCRQRNVSREGWPFKLDGKELTHAGREAIRRWWKEKCFKNPSKAARVLLTPEAAALTTRDYARTEPTAPYLGTFRLFERAQLDEHKVDAMFTLEVPMLDGRTSHLVTRRLWMLGMVECSCDLSLASGISYGQRYKVEDVLRLLYRSVRPPERYDLALKHGEFDYLPQAAYAAELPDLAALKLHEICLDSDSTHLSPELLGSVEQVLGCKVVNGRVGVPEKNHVIERLFALQAPEWAILPSATGSWYASPLRDRPAEKAESLHIVWRHAAHIVDVLMRNRNVEPRISKGGYSPLQEAQEMLKGGRVVKSSLGVFSEPTLYRFLPRYEAQLTHLRAHPSSPFVICCQYGKYTSRELNREEIRHLLFTADKGVDLYVQEDARFAVAVLRGIPGKAIRVALMGPRAANAHTLAMRTLDARVGKRVRNQFEARNIDPMLGATIAIAQSAKKNSAEAHFVAPSLAFLQRVEHGEVVYVDLPEDERARLSQEAAAIAREDGWIEEDAEQEGNEVAGRTGQPDGSATVGRSKQAASPPIPVPVVPHRDPYGFMSRPR